MTRSAPVRLLVFNAGSSSVKFAVYEHGEAGNGSASAAPTALLHGEIAGVGGDHPPRFSLRRGGAAPQLQPPDAGGTSHSACFSRIVTWLRQEPVAASIAAIGHRIVHGGAAHSAPARIDAALLADLKALVPLAPLHQPHGLEGIRVASRQWPDIPQVACFDTAFHRAQSEVAQAYALPLELRRQGICRYGFHGLSCEHALQRLRALAPAVAEGRLVIAHLGGGSSLTAVKAGCSVANTMGFTALDGLAMGTRCGSLDPGVILHLLRQGYEADGIEDLLYRRSGLLGLSGRTPEMRSLLEHAATDPASQLAIDYFVYRVMRETGSLAAALGGLDALVFTGGIGENSAELRARIARGLQWLGLTLDETANQRSCAGGALLISAPQSRVAAWIVPADEESVIAAAAAGLCSHD